jgi:hypothetical protein
VEAGAEVMPHNEILVSKAKHQNESGFLFWLKDWSWEEETRKNQEIKWINWQGMIDPIRRELIQERIQVKTEFRRNRTFL